jgi:hypothetical protein
MQRATPISWEWGEADVSSKANRLANLQLGGQAEANRAGLLNLGLAFWSGIALEA